MGFWSEQVTRYQELLAALSSGVNASVTMGGVQYTQKDLAKVQGLLIEAEREAVSRGELAAPSRGSCLTTFAKEAR